jgi:hypothetical protein
MQTDWFRLKSTKKALTTSINESISFRLKSALSINEQIEKHDDKNIQPLMKQ